MADYARAGALFKSLRRRLRLAETRKDWPRVEAVAREFFRTFDAEGLPYPDDWALFQRALDDVAFEKRRSLPWGEA